MLSEVWDRLFTMESIQTLPATHKGRCVCTVLTTMDCMHDRRLAQASHLASFWQVLSKNIPGHNSTDSKHSSCKALLKLLHRNRNPHAGCLHCTGFRSQPQAGCLPLYPAGISNSQAPKPGQCPTANCSYQEGCSTVDSSPQRNIRIWASGHPCEGGCQRRTAWQQYQLQWKDHHQSTFDAKATEGYQSPAVLGTTRCSGGTLYQT